MEGREDGKGKSVEEVRKWGKRRTDELRMEGKDGKGSEGMGRMKKETWLWDLNV